MTRRVEGKIEITAVPDGEAPLEIREQWVGLILPVVAITESIGMGVVTKSDTDSNPAYMVLQEYAISALSKKSDKAARWWKKHGFPQQGEYFGFKVSQTKVIGILKEEASRHFIGQLEVGSGAEDHPSNG